MRPPVTASLLAAALLAAGCAGRQPEAVWGARWPSAGDLGDAAVAAARSPATWAPLAGALVLAVGDLDEDLSEWGADHTPIFGSDARSDSDDLERIAEASWLITALAAPSPDVASKAGGLGVGAATLVLERTITDAIKETADRRRPDGSDERSFTSGHAGTASAATTLARRNLSYIEMPDWLDTSLRIGLHGVAIGTGWARVEAERHHVTDVLAGYALGHFIAAFMDEAFMRPGMPPVQVRFQALDGGGALTLIVSGRSAPRPAVRRGLIGAADGLTLPSEGPLRMSGTFCGSPILEMQMNHPCEGR